MLFLIAQQFKLSDYKYLFIVLRLQIMLKLYLKFKCSPRNTVHDKLPRGAEVIKNNRLPKPLCPPGTHVQLKSRSYTTRQNDWQEKKAHGKRYNHL